ncbi:MAG: hypothetical protein J2P51_15090 [Hyphomicrobiaceae bacterium]|nr:hypothetical protein [Hyphomicrobiaceae bacterium]
MATSKDGKLTALLARAHPSRRDLVRQASATAVVLEFLYARHKVPALHAAE